MKNTETTGWTEADWDEIRAAEHLGGEARDEGHSVHELRDLYPDFGPDELKAAIKGWSERGR